MNGVIIVKLKHVGIPVVFLVLYVATAVLFHQLLEDAVLCSMAADLVMLALGLAYYRKFMGDAVLPLHRAAVPLSVLALAAVWFVSTVTIVWLRLAFPEVFPVRDLGQTAGDGSFYIIMTLFLAPAAEEVLFRGILFRHVKQVVPTWAAYLVTNVVFALFHGTSIHLYGALAAGMLFTMVYEYTGMLSAGMLVHAGYNFLTVILSQVSLPDKFFSPWTVVPMNVIMLSLFIVAGVYIEQTMPARKGFQKDSGQTRPKFLKQSVNVTVGMVGQVFLPGCVILVWDQSGTQLFNGTADALAQNPMVCGRKVAAEQSFLSTERQANGEVIPFLVLKVL